MALRPHILRYKGKLRKVDGDKLKKIKGQEETLRQELSKTKAVPKMNVFVIAAGMFVFSSNNNKLLIHVFISTADVLQLLEDYGKGDEDRGRFEGTRTGERGGAGTTR